ncbi:hypothetical protein BGW36DRAFT_414212 [Talaromyces proteolyticus]|uniref:Zn(2)-C6 fungal-type domain-containing protein n=1 Tax=Talaromyces proteolyticus TaxID=1131652 RepID=A0AAD4L397_9EURO|nr:uncharacterized protein BGW36DRAFT_414212 [Talaromyces proteolyticus]KAH8703809.1 hypothetical protein BGW36DRAFT_414212 [Talaromyces proteolyticus]
MDDSLHRILESTPKTRKVRKGTRSCWECKRRKVRCSLSSKGDHATTCVACRRRQTPCVSQEFSEDYAPSSSPRVITTVGESLPLVIPTVHNVSNTESSALLTPLSSRSSVIDQPHPSPNGHRYAEISRKLHDALPSSHDMKIIRQAVSLWPLILSQLDTRPRNELITDDQHLRREFAEVPANNAHPTIIGRYLLLLAIVLQEIHDTSEDSQMSEPIQTIQNRILDAVNSVLMSNESLVGTMEGIRCILLEGMYHANNGNTRLAWLRFRRALNLSQLLGIDRPGLPRLGDSDDSEQSSKSRYLWFRLVYFDTFYSMMLGVSQGSIDLTTRSAYSFTHLAGISQLERLHVEVAARIIERDKRFSFAEEFEITRDIDNQLLQGALDLPTTSWLPFSPSAGLEDKQAADIEFKEVMGLVDVLHHYTLLNQLHLPYILCSNPRNTSYEYSKIACTHASREILTRFTLLLNLERVKFYCKRVDYFVLIAATTLMLVYLDYHNSSQSGSKTSQLKSSILTPHQRLSDRAIMKQVLRLLQKSSAEGFERSLGKGLNLLLCLLSIEADAATGQVYTISTDMGHGDSSPDGCQQQQRETEYFEPQSSNVEDSVSINLPYLGAIKITRQVTNPPETTNLLQPVYSSNNNHLLNRSDRHALAQETERISYSSYALQNLDNESTTTTQMDWFSFQDFDLAFFDSLIAGENSWAPTEE